MQNHEILIASSDSKLRNQFCNCIQLSDIELRYAEDAAEFLVEALNEQIQIIIFDMCLKGDKVFDLLTTVRKLRPCIPIVVIEKPFTDADGKKLSQIGVDYRLVRPFGHQEVTEIVKALLIRQRR